MRDVLIIIVLILVLGGSTVGALKYYQYKAEQSQIESKLNQGIAIGAKAETAGTVAAGKIYAKSVAKERKLEGTHTENAEKLKSAPGADHELDPAYIKQLNDGLCEYEATQCASSN